MNRQSLITILLTILLSCIESNIAYAYEVFEVKNADGVNIHYTYLELGDYAIKRTVKVSGFLIFDDERNEFIGGYSGNVVIPDYVTYDGRTLKVTRIGEEAFWMCFYLTSVTIPNTVTHIEDGAFRECI